MSKVINGDIIKNEPALAMGLVNAVIALLVSFGADLNDEQVGSIVAVSSILLAVAARKLVTPNNKLEPVAVVEAEPVTPPDPTTPTPTWSPRTEETPGTWEPPPTPPPEAGPPEPPLEPPPDQYHG